MSVYKTAISPILDRFDSETLHSLAVESLHFAAKTRLTLFLAELAANGGTRFKDARLEVGFDGIHLDSPLMVAAGWDKAGRAVEGMRAMGFSCAEVGTVTLRPQVGNPRPRLFSLASGVFLNSLGFNSPGADGVAGNLEKSFPFPMPVGISIGLNKDGDPAEHAETAKKLLRFASYFAVNVSSPNTPGLRDFQAREYLSEILKAVVSVAGEIPVYVKVSPELSFAETDGVIDAVLSAGARGVIATNTTNSPQIKAKYGERWAERSGGVSGDDEDYRKLSTERVRYIRSQTKGKITVIGSGAVKDAETALEKIKAGASAVQIFTAIRGEGAGVAGNINRGLVRFMEKEGIKSVSEIVGADV
ncbi:MAG: quinone-dependent dihydroorotate dehydrogenase [Candidatus Dadabacteria bacterium]|nr:quinone-dependent dihydroorotate dehydrogenase [Candidatus Dadabacteria bacterium]